MTEGFLPWSPFCMAVVVEEEAGWDEELFVFAPFTGEALPLSWTLFVAALA